MIDQRHIRNFSIIAHIDHGKSTLSDRLIEKCGAVEQRIMEDQILDNIDVLVDGPFMEKKLNLKLKFRGSENQRIIDMRETRKQGSIVLHPLNEYTPLSQ